MFMTPRSNYQSKGEHLDTPETYTVKVNKNHSRLYTINNDEQDDLINFNGSEIEILREKLARK